MKRELYMAVKTIENACLVANSLDCAKEEEIEISEDERKQIVDYLKDNLSKNQVESLINILDKSMI